jgi:hypothetical protein
LKTAFKVLVLKFPLSRAEHRRGGRKKRVGLSERSEFRLAPTPSTTRRIRGARAVSFASVFFHVKENEETN